VITGDWRNLFQQLDKIEKVTAADVQRCPDVLHYEKSHGRPSLKLPPPRAITGAADMKKGVSMRIALC